MDSSPALRPMSSSDAADGENGGSAVPAFRIGGHKSCDACKDRKVKCPNENYPGPCGNCIRRKTTCHFGTKKVPKRSVTKRAQSLTRPGPYRSRTSGASAPDGSPQVGLPSLSVLHYSSRTPPPPLRPLSRHSEPGLAKAAVLSSLAGPGYALPPTVAIPGQQGLTPAESQPPPSPLHSTAPSSVGVASSGPIVTVAANASVASHLGGSLVPRLFVDHLLEHAECQAPGKEATPSVKGNGIFGDSYSLTFFSESRLQSLSSRLRNNKVNELTLRISAVVASRIRRPEPSPAETVSTVMLLPSAGGVGGSTGSVSNRRSGSSGSNDSNGSGVSGDSTNGTGSNRSNDSNGRSNRNSSPVGVGVSVGGASASAAASGAGMTLPPVDADFAAACIASYFQRVHCLYPFLDRAAYEARATDPDLSRSLNRSRAWSALYHSVLAIGCSYLGDEDYSISSSGGGGGRSGGVGAGVGVGVGGGGGGGGDSFEPGKGTAWRLFSVALASFSELVVLPDSLTTLQALTAMAIYGLGVSCLSVERVLLAEAARRAQSLASAGSGGGGGRQLSTVVTPPGQLSPATTFQRTFWVLYGIEKILSFHFGRSSMFIDSDIACPFPHVPEAEVVAHSPPGAGFGAGLGVGAGTGAGASLCRVNWFLIRTRHARLLSRTYAALFSVGAACTPSATSLATIDQLMDEIEAWRQSIPDMPGLRPERVDGGGGGGGKGFESGDSGASMGDGHGHGHGRSHGNSHDGRRRPHLAGANPTEVASALSMSYLYHSYVLILSRTRQHHLMQMQAGGGGNDGSGHGIVQPDSERAVKASARAILELTPFIDVEPYTPLWTLAVIPLSALFVLFDLVVHYPAASDVARSLALLDMGAGYFSRIEYASGNALPGSLISEFAHIARDYINDFQRQGTTATMSASGSGGGGLANANGLITTSSNANMLSDPLGISAAALPLPPLPPPPPSLLLSAPPPALSTTTTAQISDASTSSLPPPLSDTVMSDISSLQPPHLSQQPQQQHLGLMGADWADAAAGVQPFSDGFVYDTSAAGGDFCGTDVMGLFSYFLPEMDAFMTQG